MLADLIERGRTLHRGGDLGKAAALYEEARRVDPGHPEPWHLLGVIALQKGDAAGAERLIREALARGEPTAKILSNHGAALTRLGRAAEAEAAFRKAALADPVDPAGWYNLGSLLLGRGQAREARESFERVVALRPDHGAALTNLGVIAREANDFMAAKGWFERAAALPGGDPLPFLNLGGLFKEKGLAAEAEAAFAEAARRGAKDAAVVQQATVLPAVYEDEADLMRWRGLFEDRVARLERDPPRIADPLREVGLCAFYLVYHGLDDRPLQERLAAIYRRACPALSFVSPHLAEVRRRSSPRLRIGLVSKYWRQHTVGKLNRGLVERLDRRRFEVVLLAAPGPVDADGRAIREAADRVVALPPDLPTAQRMVAEERLDLLHFTDIGMDPFTYFLAFGRHAPVQTVSWGHPVTSGLSTLDYFLIQRDMEGEEGEARYTERLVRLAEIPTFYRRPTPPPGRDRPYFRLPETGTLYLCPQSLFKLHPAFDRQLAAVLAGDPEGHVVFIDTFGIEALRDKLTRRFRRALGEGAERVVFVPPQPAEDFLALIQVCDLMLDPFPFGGGNTSFEALSLGTPIVTRRIGILRGDPTAGMLLRMGMPELVAATGEEYRAIALRLGRDAGYRREIRARIAASAGVLFENQAHVDEISDFFEKVVAEARRGT